MVKRRPESTGGKQVTGRELTQFKPGQSGNPKGRPQGSRNKLSEEFFRDLCDAWQPFGKAALMTAAWTHPIEFVRVVASLMPREFEATITTVTERMSDEQLTNIIARGIEGGLGPAAPDHESARLRRRPPRTHRPPALQRSAADKARSRAISRRAADQILAHINLKNARALGLNATGSRSPLTHG